MLAGCYSPTVTPGVACVDACPGEQVCIDGVCRDPGYVGDAMTDADAMIDGAPDVDTDGDGVLDGADNCSAVTNADQHDEDADALGDACDPCPHVALGAAADQDADGVGDACDPEPAVGRQRWRVFDPLTSRAAAWSMSNAATFGADSMTLDDGFIRYSIAISDFRVQFGGSLVVTPGVAQQLVIEIAHQMSSHYYYGEFYGDGTTGYMKITRRDEDMYQVVEGVAHPGSLPSGPFTWAMDASVASQTIAFDTQHGSTDFPLLEGATTTPPLVASTFIHIGTNDNIDVRLDYFVVIETIP